MDEARPQNSDLRKLFLSDKWPHATTWESSLTNHDGIASIIRRKQLSTVKAKCLIHAETAPYAPDQNASGQLHVPQTPNTYEEKGSRVSACSSCARTEQAPLKTTLAMPLICGMQTALNGHSTRRVQRRDAQGKQSTPEAMLRALQ